MNPAERAFGRALLRCVTGDITTQSVDAIVNAANSGLMGGGGVDGAIHDAGGPAILQECREIVQRQGRCPPGGAVITGGGRLPAKWVIHAVGPIWRGGTRGEEETLASAYRESLARAGEAGARTVAFPSISTGVYGYPVERAAPVALGSVAAALKAGDPFDEVRFVLFDDRTFGAYEVALAKID